MKDGNFEVGYKDKTYLQNVNSFISRLNIGKVFKQEPIVHITFLYTNP